MVKWGVIVKSVVTVRHLFLSPGHNFFGRHGQPAGGFPTTDFPVVSARAGRGLEGDRFFDYRPDYHGQVTFFSWEVVAAARQQFSRPELGAEAFRRNVIVAGADLNALIGLRFTLGGIDFEGVCESKPCYWMNTVIAPGAEEWLRGQGGLRAKILTDGELRRGPAELIVPSLLELG